MSQVRVRFAPSPTGFFHIGGARTALFNWLYARSTGGTFVLRIEDTDQERNTEEALRFLMGGMRWLGIDWDEGPEKGGDCGPYFQSQRSEIYDAHLKKLQDAGRVYEKEGALWFKISGETQVIHDAVRGKVERKEEKDFVIYRSNGSPVFHFVNVVDDLTMGITHVIRGEDHLSNTSKHTELFKAFGATPPVFAHIPLILKDPSQGKGKMSKRDKGSCVEEYEQRHFLPAALRNYLCLLGWNPKDDSEILSIEEVISRFDLSGVNKDNARFDEKKLAFINAEYVRALPADELLSRAKSVLSDAGLVDDATDANYVSAVVTLCQQKLRSFEDLPNYVSYFFKDSFEFNEKTGRKLTKNGDAADKLNQAIAHLQPLSDWTVSTIEQAFAALAESEGQEKPFPWFPITRYAVSGLGGGPDLIPMLAVMGKERVISRMKTFIQTL